MRLLLLSASEKSGNHFVTPAGNTIAYAKQPVLSIFSCQLWYVSARIRSLFSAERLSGSCQKGQVVIQTGLVWEVTQKLNSSPALSHSCCSTNVPFLNPMEKKIHLQYDTNITRHPNVLIHSLAGVVLQWQRSISYNKWARRNFQPEGALHR